MKTLLFLALTISQLPASSTLTLPPLHRPSSRLSTTSTDTPCPNLPPLTPLDPKSLPSILTTALSSVASLFEASLNSTNRPGGAIKITYGMETLLEAYSGVSDRATSKPVDASTLFRIASVSKLFPAILLYQLVDAGYVGLDDPLQTQMPFSVKNVFDDSLVTFRQLASHTSGLQREAPPGDTTPEVLAALAKTYLILPPGTLPSYSNLGFGLLGHALAEYVAPTPTTPAALITDSILTPLNMSTNTGFNYSSEVLARLAVGYDPSGSPVPFVDLGWWYPAGSMYSTVSDLTTLGQALMMPGSSSSKPPNPLSISTARLREFLKPSQWNRDGESLFGSPWECRASLSHLQLTKGGNLPGYSASVLLVPTLNLTVAVTWNGGGDEVTFMDALAGVLLPALDAALTSLAPLPLYPPGPFPTADYVGNYSIVGGGSEVSVTVVEGGYLLWHELSVLKTSFFLEWFGRDEGEGGGGDLFRVAFPDSAFTCLLGEMEALRYQVVVFARDGGGGGAVVSTAVPGWVPGGMWEKVA